MRRRAWGFGIGVAACLLAFGVFPLPSAVAATSSWEWESSSSYPGEIGNFGQTLAGGGPTEPHEYVLANTGEAPIIIERFIFGVQTTAERHRWSISHNDCKKGLMIASGQTCSVDVVFDPLTPGWKLGRLRVEAVGGEPSEARIEYEGHAVGPWVEPEPRRLEFGSVQVGAGPSPIQTITVTNGEPLPLDIYGTSVTDIYDRPELSSPFSVAGGTCQEGVVITTLESCTVEVDLEPTAVGPIESKLWISDNAEGPQSVLVRGSGAAPPVEPPGPPATVAPPEPERPSTSPPQGEATAARNTLGESSPTVSNVKPLVCPRRKRKVSSGGKRICVDKHRRHRSPGARRHRRGSTRKVAALQRP